MSVNQYVFYLSIQVEKRLAKRLQAGIRAWTQCLLGDDKQGMDDNMDTDAPAKVKPGGDPKITVSSGIIKLILLLLLLLLFACLFVFIFNIFITGSLLWVNSALFSQWEL